MVFHIELILSAVTFPLGEKNTNQYFHPSTVKYEYNLVFCIHDRVFNKFTVSRVAKYVC
jgi:hypothetical protein